MCGSGPHRDLFGATPVIRMSEWRVTLTPVIGTSIVFLPVWEKIAPNLLVDIYSRERGVREPRIRIGFVDLPESLSREIVMLVMPCVCCERPIHPLRKRLTDTWDGGRIYYAPTCPLTVRIGCSRSRAAELEYERFVGIWSGRGIREDTQLVLFT